MTFIKICGITNVEDALRAASLGADALGFIFAPSPRKINIGTAQSITGNLSGNILKVGVFVNEGLEKVNEAAVRCGFNSVQLHGRESPGYCAKVCVPVIKAVAVGESGAALDIEEYPAALILLDSASSSRAGGTGKTFDWTLALDMRKRRNFILSAGLNPYNVAEAIRFLKPFGVDVCSGVEASPGKKDPTKMAEFIRAVRKADEELRVVQEAD